MVIGDFEKNNAIEWWASGRRVCACGEEVGLVNLDDPFETFDREPVLKSVRNCE